MLLRKTCLLLGAGASKHLSFPLGEELRKKMLFELLGQKDKEPATLPDDYKRGGEDLTAFYDKLAYGNWSSPDAFLEHHPEFIKTGKYMICRCLSEFEQPWGVTQHGGWYDRLVSAIHVDDPKKLRSNQLSVVTFNYDRSIDFRLHKYIENHFGMTPEEAWKVLTDSIPIVHVHGTLGEYPKWEYGAKSSVWQRGQDIKIVSEIEEDTPEFRRASELLNGADRVVVFGFGFAPDNVRRLNFFKECDTEDRDIVIATGGSRGLAYQKRTCDWLARWGLKQTMHHYPTTANEIFDSEVDPFA